MGTITLVGVSKEDLELTGKFNEMGLTVQQVANAVKKSNDTVSTANQIDAGIDKLAAITVEATEINDVVYNLKDLTSSASQIDSGINNTKTCVLIGDSITEANAKFTTGYSDYNTSGYFTWLQIISGRAFKCLNFAGISGQTSTQIAARFEADVIAYSPKYCFLLCGMNDTADETGTTTIKNNIIKMYNKANTNGIFLFLLTMTATTSTTVKNKQALEVNRWMISEFANKNNVLVIDIGTVTRDNNSLNGNLIASTSYDDKHPNTKGAFMIGSYIYNKIKHLITENYRYVSKSAADCILQSANSKNYYNYPIFTGTVTSGKHQTVILGTAINATYTPTVEASLDGIGNAQCIDITATAPAVLHSQNMYLDFSTGFTCAIGDKFYIACEIDIDAGATNLQNVTLAVNIGAVQVEGFDARNVNTVAPSGLGTEATKLYLETPVITATTANTLMGRCLILFGAAGHAKIRISKMTIVKAN